MRSVHPWGQRAFQAPFSWVLMGWLSRIVFSCGQTSTLVSGEGVLKSHEGISPASQALMRPRLCTTCCSRAQGQAKRVPTLQDLPKADLQG